MSEPIVVGFDPLRGDCPIRSVPLGGHTHALVRRAQSPLMIVPRGAGSALEQPPAGSQAAAP